MGEAIGSSLGFAVGIAISPIPIAAVILMLFSGRARSNSVAFLVAWLVGIALVTTVVVNIPGLEADDSGPSTTAGWVKLVLGVLLAFAGIRQWTSRPGPGDEVDTPAWMAKIDDLQLLPAFGLGFLLSALNPKNLLLAAAAGASLGALPLTTAETTGAIVIFTLIASLTVAVPVLGFLVAGDRLGPVLDRSKAWLIENNGAVMAVLFIVFAVSLVGDAIAILA